MRVVLFLSVLFLPFISHAKMVTDTINTLQGDQIILEYNISINGENVSFKIVDRPRIIPTDKLRKACKGDLKYLKVVLFDRVGAFDKVKWKGIAPTAFMVPAGFSYNKSQEGYYILGETATPVSFIKNVADKREISFPLYIALYEKKQTYKIVSSSSEPLKISIGETVGQSSRSVRSEQIAIQSAEELEADNNDVVNALSSMQMIRQLLATESELPFSQALQMEINHLRTLKDNVRDRDVVEKINEVLLLCNDKEQELKNAQKEATLAAQAREQDLISKQKAEEEARLQEAEEKARIQEEKQQKRTIWMLIGGASLAVFAFVGNGILKHFREVRNQKSIMEMQAALAKQAEHEASRRTREIVRNKAHQVANKGKSKMRESLNETGRTKTNSRIRSI